MTNNLAGYITIDIKKAKQKPKNQQIPTEPKKVFFLLYITGIAKKIGRTLKKQEIPV